MTLEQLTKNIQIISIICNQWGDTGKGKFSDYFAANFADVNARSGGGNNAGHTTEINGKKRIFHLLPAGIIHDNKGKVNILGNGMVLDLKVLNQELNELDKENLFYNNLMISQDANVIMPYHILRDQKKNTSQKKGGIGSTGRGIGPCYADKIARRGIFVRDLFNEDTLSKKIEKALEFYPELKSTLSKKIKKYLGFYSEPSIDKDQIIEELTPYATRIKPFVRDTISEMHGFVKNGKKILLEGAQGLLLSIEFGTYPYVTSSDCSINGVAAGVGLPAKAIDLPLGIVKFPYMTRVGAGPFPTEFAGQESEKYCAKGLKHDIKFELKIHEIPFEEKNGNIKYDHHHEKIIELMNSDDSFLQGVGIRLSGEEYGATTGRPRRTGWTDLVALKYAIGINGPNIILTKPDVLQGAREIKLGIGYDKTPNFTRDSDLLKTCTPSYKSFQGSNEDLFQIDNYRKLPPGLKQRINFVEESTGGIVRIVSTGADRNQTIIK